ncbi:MAG TPA: hypothetical protein VLA03_05815, partial [Draconibacterium sp.]|nr:hypothetical protein [Draconibacterium sp.]
LAPVLCSLLMILIALIFDNLIANDKLKKIIPFEWILMIVGAATIFFTFTLDFGMILIRGDFLPKYFTLADNQEFLKILTTWEPTRFNWGIFVLGIGLICTGLFLVLKRVLNK